MYIRHWARKRALMFYLIYKWLNINILPPHMQNRMVVLFAPISWFFLISSYPQGIVWAGTRNDKHDGHRRHNDADNVLSMG